MKPEEPLARRHEEYMRRYMGAQASLRAYVLSIVRDFHTMEDVLQEVAVAAWRSYDTYEPSRPFVAWVLGIARNKSLDVLRARNMTPLLPEEVLRQMQEDTASLGEEWIERRRVLAACLEKLTPNLRAVLELRLRENIDVQGISSREGKTANAIRKLLARARAFLAQCTGRTLNVGAG